MGTFHCTKKIEKVTLSAGKHHVSLWGAQGGDCVAYSKSGGKGAHASTAFTLKNETNVLIIVGCKGESNPSDTEAGGGGGGGSFIYSGTNLICAAGGGGGAGREDGCPGESTTSGTSLYASGGMNGEGGNAGQEGNNAGAGGAGFLSDGKIHSTYQHTGGKCPSNGCFGGTRKSTYSLSSNGGFGGGGASLNYYGAGGGGGYSGGAGGSNSYPKGGGGGSFTSGPGETHSGSTTFGRTGDGLIEISSFIPVQTKCIFTIACKSQMHIILFLIFTQSIFIQK